jgi:hypothetical protein
MFLAYSVSAIGSSILDKRAKSGGCERIEGAPKAPTLKEIELQLDRFADLSAVEHTDVGETID